MGCNPDAVVQVRVWQYRGPEEGAKESTCIMLSSAVASVALVEFEASLHRASLCDRDR